MRITEVICDREKVCIISYKNIKIIHSSSIHFNSSFNNNNKPVTRNYNDDDDDDDNNNNNIILYHSRRIWNRSPVA
jgi:hypothetical protein